MVFLLNDEKSLDSFVVSGVYEFSNEIYNFEVKVFWTFLVGCRSVYSISVFVCYFM